MYCCLTKKEKIISIKQKILKNKKRYVKSHDRQFDSCGLPHFKCN